MLASTVKIIFITACAVFPAEKDRNLFNKDCFLPLTSVIF
jgi:hypothetical protein